MAGLFFAIIWSMINETFQVSAYDGYAIYQVTQDYGDGTVQIEHVGDGLDNYTAPVLGHGCRISRENIQDVIDGTTPNGEYVTLDGRYTIGKGEAFTSCSNPHPMGNGAYCYGNQDHTYDSWEVWDNERGAFLNDEPHYDTLKEAREALADELDRHCPISLRDTGRFIYV